MQKIKCKYTQTILLENMGSKWNDSGILRKKQMKDNFDDLLVFGYACKLFRDDERALYIDQGKHLIPWMGDDSLKIDRYDARGALSDLSKCEASREGYDATRWLDLNETDRKLEQLCDVERYYSLHENTDEETTYKDEELKRKTANEFHFNYNVPNECGDTEPVAVATCEEEDKEFIPSIELNVPADMEIPKTVKVNARIEKTALFVSQQGPQMEILLKAKQSNNPQFSFLNHNDPLQKYYKFLLNAIKSGQYRIRKDDSQDMNQQPEMNTTVVDVPKESDHHLRPVLILSQPATVMSVVKTQHVPSPPYYTSGACTYTNLVSHIKGSTIGSQQNISNDIQPLSSGEQTQTSDQYYHYYQTQYYQYYHQLAQQYASHGKCEISAVMQNPSLQDQIQRQAVQYAQAACVQYTQNQLKSETVIIEPPKIVSTKPTGKLSLVHYSSDSEENSYDEDSGTEDKFTFSIPPDDIAVIVDKMATYVLKNGPDFEDTVKNKGDARFDFLQESHKYYSYYKFKIAEYTARKKMPLSEGAAPLLPDQKSEQSGKTSVCFSIRKHRDDAPKDIKSALPIEESDEEDVANTSEEKINPETAKLLIEKEDISTDAVLTESISLANNHAKASSPIEVIDLTAADGFVDAHVKREEDVTANKDWMTSEVHERAVQIQRRKRAALFLKLKSKNQKSERHKSKTIRSENAQSYSIMQSRTVTSTHSDSELEDGEIKSHSSTNTHHRKKSSRKRSKRRRNHSETKSTHRKHRKRKVSSYTTSSSASSELD